MVDIYSRRKARGYASRFRVTKERALDCILDLNMVWNLKLTIGRIPIDILRILVDRYLSKERRGHASRFGVTKERTRHYSIHLLEPAGSLVIDVAGSM